MKKTIIFSHESDIDGMGSIILGKLVFKDIDIYLYPNTDKLEENFRKYIESGILDNYDNIFITDLALHEPSLSLVANSKLKDKVKVFDHHQAAINLGLDKYPFTTIIEEDELGKKCGTQLFYNYLTQNNYLKKNKALDMFVEFTRLEDNWEWKKNKLYGIKAHDLSVLFSVIGYEKYCEVILKCLSLNNDEFILDNESISIIEEKKEKLEHELLKLSKEIEIFYDELNNKYGAVFANYEYRNELTEYVTKNMPELLIKYMIIVALDKGEYGQKSYRKIANEMDVNEIAMMHGGGGHKGAAMVNITKEQNKYLKTLPKRKALQYICESSYK